MRHHIYIRLLRFTVLIGKPEGFVPIIERLILLYDCVLQCEDVDMTIKQGEIAKAKLRMLEIYIQNPKTSNAEMGRLCRLDDHTVAKYKGQLFEMLKGYKEKVELVLEEKIEAKVGIWQSLTRMFKNKSGNP